MYAGRERTKNFNSRRTLIPVQLQHTSPVFIQTSYFFTLSRWYFRKPVGQALDVRKSCRVHTQNTKTKNKKLYKLSRGATKPLQLQNANNKPPHQKNATIRLVITSPTQIIACVTIWHIYIYIYMYIRHYAHRLNGHVRACNMFNGITYSCKWWASCELDVT